MDKVFFRKRTWIDQTTLGYKLTKIYAAFCYWIFNRRTKVVNRDSIPKKKPIIFAPIHNNPVMDAMAVLHHCGRDAVFVARADAFTHPVVLKILTFFKMLPIYRLRDGASELQRNEEIFNTTVDILKRGSTFGIMPEGSHGNKRRLRPFVKGIFRIAFRAQEDHGEEDFLQIVPVGIDYSHYVNFRPRVLIWFGNPIPVSEFWAEYMEHPARAINSLRKRMVDEFMDYIIHIESEDFYDMYMAMREIYNPEMRRHMGLTKNNMYNRFRAGQEMIRTLYEEETCNRDRISELAEKVSRLVSSVKKMNSRLWVFNRKNYSFFLLLPLSIGMLLLFPLFLYGLINNIIPYNIPKLMTRKFKDVQFHSTVKYVFGLATIPFIYFIQFIPIWIFADPGWLKWIYLASLLPSGIFAHEYYITLKKLRSMWKYWFLTVTGNRELKNLKALRNEIVAETDLIIKN
jgi:1-acyl-sn-glycerol-3-phosphate acyltransferase